MDCRLYVITGESYHPGRTMTEVMEAALAGGADIVQLRDKNATAAELLGKAVDLRRLTRRYGALFVVNDDVELALAADADGVHLGQDDMPLAQARHRAGRQLLIGISTHNIEQALAAERGGADYIGVGPVYPTATKPGRQAVTTAYVAEAAAAINIPFFAIGGIAPATAETVLAAGARRLCAVSAVVGAPDPTGVCIALKRDIERWEARGGRRPESEPGAAAGADKPDEPAAGALTLLLNGKRISTGAATLGELAHTMGLAGRRVMAEREGEAVPRADWDTTRLQAGDRIEFVQFVGGG